MHDKDATPIEAIDFETLQADNKQSNQSNQRLNSKPILWFSFIFLLICALVVFLFLPEYISNQQHQKFATSQETIELPPTAELPEAEIDMVEPVAELLTEELSALKQEAEKLLLQLITKQKLLESKAVKKWASEEFEIVLNHGSIGDELFRKKEYQQAITAYKDAIIILQELEQKITPILEEHLSKGELALTQAEKDTAIFHFELAKSIDTDNIQAKNGLKRAKTINELYALLEQGGRLEAANKFTDAKFSYQEAVELDPLSVDAKNALARVSAQLAQNEFTKLINQGYSSLKLRQYGDARTAFKAAQKLSPNSDKPKQGLASITQAIRKEKVSALAAEAQYFETDQDWDNAAKSYQQILTLSPNYKPALQGLERSNQRKEILIKLDEYINNKLRLGTEQVAREADQFVQKIALVSNLGSRIEQRTVELKKLLRLAKQPISITLQSDNQTDIAIFKVGRFGKFEQRKVELKTGKYTIVGSRTGFRDVRKVITVTAEMSSKTIIVHCDEPI